jgi:UDP-N-acetylmuramoyl-tripeptide--D-alanyl-D-alanine ligase
VGELAKWMAEAFGENATHFQNQSDLIDELKRSVKPSIAILVKGSRSAQMEAVVRQLIEKG